MTRLFWVEDRLSWPLVIAVAYMSLSLLAADFAWRVVQIAFDTLLLWVVTVDAAIALLLIALYLRYRTRSRRP